MCALFSRFNKFIDFHKNRAFFFHFFFVRHFGPIDKKESLPTPRTNKVCTPLLSSLLFLLSIIFSLGRRRRRTFHHHLWTTVLRVDCHSRAPRTYKRRRSSHAPFDRERKRKRKRCDGRSSSSRLLLRRALCVTFFWRRVFDSRRRRRFVRRRERCGSDDSSRSETAISAFLSRARAHSIRAKERHTLPPRRSLRFARLVIDASLKPLRLLSLRALCTPGDGDRETERTKSAFFQIRDKDLD